MAFKLVTPFGQTPADLRSRALDLLPAAALFCLCAHSLLVSTTTHQVGPVFWDEFKYAYRALDGEFDRGVRSRYVHIWLLRVFYELVSDRVLAASLYASLVNTGLLLVTYALGRRAMGPAGGLLSALIAYQFAPLSMYWTEPLADPPSTLFAGLALLCAFRHRDGGRPGLWSLLCGLSMFASIKCKETGLTVAPALLWLMSERRDAFKRTLVFGLLGVACGQVMLCLADWTFAGDAFQSLRASLYKSYVGAITSKPKAYASGKQLMRDEWFAQLLSRGVRETAVAGLLGLALGYRRSVVLRALSVWMIFNLFFGAWVSWRYAGIDAVTRYLVPFAPALCVGSAYLFFHAARRSLASDELPAPLSAAIALLAITVGTLGLWQEWPLVLDLHATTNGSLPPRMLFEIAVPVCLIAATLIPSRGLRIFPLALALIGLLLSGSLHTVRNLEKAQAEQRGWTRLARKMSELNKYELSLLNLNPRHPSPLDTASVVWRVVALGSMPPARVQARTIEHLSDARPHELILVDYGTRREARLLHRFKPKPPYRRVQWLSRGHLRTEVFELPADAATLPGPNP